jgi:hypothetical protein
MLRSTLAVASVSLLTFVGCAPPIDAVEQHGSEVEAPDPSSGHAVLRERVVFEGSEDQLYRTREPEPFSHMARRWHSYPFTVYRRARIGARLTTDDPAMLHRAAVFLYGPLR